MKHVRLFVMFSETFHTVTNYEFHQIDKENYAPNECFAAKPSHMLNGNRRKKYTYTKIQL